MAKKYGNVELLPIEKNKYGNVELLPVEPKPTTYGNVELLPIKPESKTYGNVELLPIMPTTKRYGNVELLPVPTQTELKVREFQEQWRKENPAKVEYGDNDYTPVSYFGAGMHKSVQYDLEDWKPMPYKSIDVEQEEFKGIAQNILMNYLQRGNWAAANVADRIAKGDYGDTFSAAWRGLSGKEQRYFSDVLKGAGVDNTEAGILGFVLDMGLDPINYVPLGKGIRLAKKGISKSELFKEMAKTGFVKNLQKLFSPGQGMPKELYKFIKYRGRDLDAKQWKVIERTKKLFKATTKESREMMSRIRAGKLPVEKLTTKQRKVYDIVVNKLRTLGKEAVDAKLISNEAYLKNIDDYIHGFTKGKTKLGGLTGRAGKAVFRKPKVWKSPVDQVDWATALKDSMKRVDNVDEARKLAVKSGLVDNASTLTFKEIKSSVKNIKLEEMDLLKTTALREIEGIREVGRITMVNEAMRTFGKPLPKGLKALPDDMAVYIPRGTVPDMFLKESDDVSKGIKVLLGKVKQDLVEIPVDMAQALKTRRGAPKAYMIPREIAHHLNLIGDYLTPGGEELNLLMKGLDKVQGLWKGLVTAVRPSFHMRNATSNVFLSWLSGIDAIDLMPRHAGAIKMAKKSLDKISTRNFGKLKYSQIEDLCKQVGSAGRGWMGAAEPHKIWNALEDLFDPKISLRKYKKLNPIELGRNVGQAIEDASRRAVFLDEIVKSNKPTLGEAAIDAAERVGKFLYDYDELSLFEKKFAKRVVPFYTWMRKNIPNMFNQLLEQPDKFSKIGKIKRISGVKETEAEKALKPDWMAKEGYLKSPFKMKGKPLYYYVDLPTKDLETLFSMRDLYSSITPFKEIPHILLNVKSFPEMGARIAEKNKEYTTAPAWMNFLPDDVKKFLKLGPGIDLSTGKTVLKIHKKVLYGMETFIPPIKDLNATSNLICPQPVEYLRNKAIYRMYSHPTGLQLRALDLNWETQSIVREMKELSATINAIVKQRTDYMDTPEYNNSLRRLEELEDRLNRAQSKNKR